MITFHTDQPITGANDSPDLLNRSQFAERVAKSLILRKNSPSLTVSLEGQWGYGKTSTINLITHHLNTWKKADQPIIYNFNPWMVGNAEKIIQEFLVQFASVIGSIDRGKNLTNAAKQVLAYSRVFDVMKFIPGAEPWASIVKSVFSNVGEAAKKMGELKQLNYEQKRNSVIKALDKTDKAIVVFIDDLDRLPPDEVFQMVRVIKAIADFPRTSFVLAFDPTYIEEALGTYGIKDPRTYLDKIVQVRLPLPQISSADLHKIAENELRTLADVNLTKYFPEDQNRLAEIYHLDVKHILESPRDIKRIYNRLRFIEPVVRSEVSFSDLFALQVLAIKAPVIYEDIKSNPDVYTGIQRGAKFSLEKPEEYIKKFEDHRKEVVEKTSKNKRQFYWGILSKLFPLLGGENWGYEGQDRYAVRGRVAAMDRLMIALTFGLPTGEVPSALMKNYITKSDLRANIIESVINNDTIERFVDLLNLHIDTLKPDDKPQFLVGLGELSSHPKIKEWDDKPRDIMFDARPILRFWWVTKGLLDDISGETRKTCIFSCAQNYKTLPLSSYILSVCLTQHGFYKPQEQITEDQRWLTGEELEKLKSLWKNAVEKNFKEGTIFKLPDKSEIVFLLKRIDKTLTENLLRPLLKTDSGLDNFAGLVGVGGADSTKGHYAKVPDDIIDMLGGREVVAKRVNKRLRKLPKDNYKIRAIYNSILTGESYYLIDASKRDRF